MSRTVTVLTGRLQNQARQMEKVANELHNYGVYGCRHDSPFDPSSKPDKPSSRVPGVPEAFSKLRELEDDLRELTQVLADYVELYDTWLNLKEGTESRVQTTKGGQR